MVILSKILAVDSVGNLVYWVNSDYDGEVIRLLAGLHSGVASGSEYK